MKNLNKQIVMLFFFAVLIATFSLNAQETKVILPESKLIVLGTSNVHDWTIEAKEMKGNLNFNLESGVLKTINTLNFSVEVEQLKSGKKGMDENTFKALKSKAHKTIDFSFSKVSKMTPTTNNTYNVEVQGDLTIAGVTKKVNLPITIVLVGKKAILSGKYNIDMTTYGVEPPKALMGTIKTGKDVTVDFKVTYN